MPDYEALNMHGDERVLRILLGLGMIFSILIIQSPVDYLVLLPLAGIYPCLTGVIGWDPLYYLSDFNPLAIDDYSDLKNDLQGVNKGINSNVYLAPRFT